MRNFASEEYLSFQQTAVHLAGEQAALRYTTKELHAEFAAAMAARDVLLAEWHGALDTHDRAPSARTARQSQGLAWTMRGVDARLVELAMVRRDLSRQRRVLRRQASHATIHALRARRALDESLFEVATPPPETDPEGNAETLRSFLHDMREHLTVAVLAAGKLATPALSPRIAHVHRLLIRGLMGLTEDLDALDPMPVVPSRPMLTLLPRTVPPPPPESTTIPGVEPIPGNDERA